MDKTSQTKEIIALYGKLFLFMGTPFILAMGLPLGILQLVNWATRSQFSSIYGSAQPSLTTLDLLIPGFGLFFGIFLGVLISFSIGTMHIAVVRGMPSGKRPGALQVHQTRSIRLKLPYDQTFDLCLEALLIRGGTIYLEKPEQGKIAARTGVNIYSGRSIIYLDVDKLGDGTSEVTISSKPAVRIAVIDMGGNLENVTNIAAFLKLKEKQALKTSQVAGP